MKSVSLFPILQYLLHPQILSEHDQDHHDPCVTITVPCVSPEALRYILNFIYFGNGDIPTGSRAKVLEAAELLQIVSLICYFQADSSLAQGVSACEQKNDSKIPNNSPIKSGRKRKTKKIKSLSDKKTSVHLRQVKKEPALQKCQTTGTYSDDELGRCRRNIKSRYSSDIYEINLPKLREFKSKKLHTAVQKAETLTVNCQVSAETSDDTDNHHTYAMTMHPGCSTVNQDAAENVLANEKDDMEKYNEINRSNGNAEILKSQLVTLPSPSTSSAVIPQLFTSDTTCLQESSTSQSFTAAALPCVSFIEQVPITGISNESFEPSSFAMVPSTSTSLLSHIKDIPLMSSPVSVQHMSLKQEPSKCHLQETSTDEKIAVEEQEDGLFKFQVGPEFLYVHIGHLYT